MCNPPGTCLEEKALLSRRDQTGQTLRAADHAGTCGLCGVRDCSRLPLPLGKRSACGAEPRTHDDHEGPSRSLWTTAAGQTGVTPGPAGAGGPHAMYPPSLVHRVSANAFTSLSPQGSVWCRLPRLTCSAFHGSSARDGQGLGALPRSFLRARCALPPLSQCPRPLFLPLLGCRLPWSPTPSPQAERLPLLCYTRTGRVPPAGLPLGPQGRRAQTPADCRLLPGGPRGPPRAGVITRPAPPRRLTHSSLTLGPPEEQ